MSTRETVAVFCPNTHREVIGLIKKNPSISVRAEVVWEYEFVYCSGQLDCSGKKESNKCPFFVTTGRP